MSREAKNVFITFLIISAIILGLGYGCVAISEKDNTKRHCAPADATLINPEMSRLATQPPAWNKVHNANEFWTSIHQQPKNLVFFGTENCGWCRTTENWWNENGAMTDWQFVDWNFMNADSDKQWEEFRKTLREVYYSRNPEGSPIGFPTCAIMVNAKPGKPLKESVVYTGLGFTECSKLMKEFAQTVK